MSYVLAMYDVRGIQDYIFKTSKLKHAIGASAIVESIIEKALMVSTQNIEADCELKWENERYTGENKDVQVLYIGGGNAFVIYKNEDLYLNITKKMSKYVLENTYSLQLAAACVPKTDNYSEDYKKLQIKMTKVKADMPMSKPVGALPIMQIELATGLPICSGEVSREVELKLDAELKKRNRIKTDNKKFDNFVEEKGENSTLAVIHIDGNNMGLRIRNYIENKTSYLEAVNAMRKLSYNINWSYKNVFEEMMNEFNSVKDYVVLPVLIAGDDITYVCTGKAAIASVERFVNKITKKSMLGDGENIDEYGLSVCAGIAFIRSHFPFSVGYEVAESCCDSAKKRAKENIASNGKVGNFYDFQFCRNVQTADLERTRDKEYVTPTNEKLICRPYEIGGEDTYYSHYRLMRYLDVFANLKDSEGKRTSEKTLPRSHAKTLRNVYPLGKEETMKFVGFLDSRNWKLPDGNNVYEENGETIAKYYDALELMDMYEKFEEIN